MRLSTILPDSPMRTWAGTVQPFASGLKKLPLAHFLIGSIVINLVFLLLLFGQQYQFDQQMKEWPKEDKRELLECKQMNENATKLLKGEILSIKIK